MEILGKTKVVVQDGKVVEGAATNICIVERGVVHTAPRQDGMLSGVSRKRALQVARKARVKVVEKAFTVPRLKKADEVFLPGTTIEVAPVAIVDGKRIGDGRPGPITLKLRKLYYQMIEKETGAKVWKGKA